ncbi:hypothetical protein ACIRLA_46625 [Streptomyces sp. NPDC102364]|uniref:hypothetical protein n=1 Tax=Streptomyces sp. NPDC102364 TaxID=3366161 RepID=UPI00382D6817
MTDPTEDQLALIDARDALAAVIIRPKNPDNPAEGVEVEAFADGITHQQMAHVLRTVAGQFDTHDGQGPAADDTAPGRP